MSKYKLDWITIGKTSTGKDKADATLLDENGIKTEVTIWGDFPGFVALAPGQEVEGEVVQSNPKYKPSLNAPRMAKTASGGAFKQKMIEDTMQKKNESISKFQGQKEESIKLISAQRDAVLIVTTFFKDGWGQDPIIEDELDALVKKKIMFYRDWFLSHEFGETLPF